MCTDKVHLSASMKEFGFRWIYKYHKLSEVQNWYLSLNLQSILKGIFSQKLFFFYSYIVLKLAAGTIFRTQNLKEKPAEQFRHFFTHFLCLRCILTLANFCTQLANFFTHFSKPAFICRQVLQN